MWEIENVIGTAAATTVYGWFFRIQCQSSLHSANIFFLAPPRPNLQHHLPPASLGSLAPIARDAGGLSGEVHPRFFGNCCITNTLHQSRGEISRCRHHRQAPSRGGSLARPQLCCFQIQAKVDPMKKSKSPASQISSRGDEPVVFQRAQRCGHSPLASRMQRVLGVELKSCVQQLSDDKSAKVLIEPF